MPIDFKKYKVKSGYDELISEKGNPRQVARSLCSYFSGISDDEVAELRQAVDLVIKSLGISFTVYYSLLVYCILTNKFAD